MNWSWTCSNFSRSFFFCEHVHEQEAVFMNCSWTCSNFKKTKQKAVFMNMFMNCSNSTCSSLAQSSSKSWSRLMLGRKVSEKKKSWMNYSWIIRLVHEQFMNMFKFLLWIFGYLQTLEPLLNLFMNSSWTCSKKRNNLDWKHWFYPLIVPTPIYMYDL